MGKMEEASGWHVGGIFAPEEELRQNVPCEYYSRGSGFDRSLVWATHPTL
jgi:hypothetical protein